MSDVRIVEGECVEEMRKLPDSSVDACVTDPPYGIEFMGAGWDKLDGDAWRAGGGFSKPGIGDRPTAWASYGQGDTANATCANCGGRMRGANRCECAEPEWRVKGKPLSESDADSRLGQARRMQEWHARWLAEALRVLKPGGFLLAFSGTRTYHRLACAAEDVGFEVRDTIHWTFGSGFPKSLNVSFAIDKHLGKDGEREVTGPDPEAARRNKATPRFNGTDYADGEVWQGAPEVLPTRGASEEARRFDGFGTALKPGHELILLARKPLVGSVAENVLAFGTGGLNIDAARIPTGDRLDGGAVDAANHLAEKRHEGYGRPWQDDPDAREAAAARVQEGVERAERLGRWPANVVLSHGEGCRLGARPVRSDGHHPAVRGKGGLSTSGHGGQEGLDESYAAGEVVEVWECEPGCPVAEMDRQSGVRRGGGAVNGEAVPAAPFGGVTYGAMERDSRQWDGYPDTGGASRFFLTTPRDTLGKCESAHETDAEQSSSRADEHTPSARSDVATSRGREDASESASRDSSAASTSGTPTGSSSDSENATPSIPSSGSECSPEQPPGEPSQIPNPARSAEPRTPTGTTTTTTSLLRSGGDAEAAMSGSTQMNLVRGDPDSRYVPKAPQAERNAGLDGPCTHPTVKPVELMRHLLRLVVPPGGLVLEPFLGSGSTAIAAELEGFDLVGFERDPEFVRIARARHAWWAEHGEGALEAMRRREQAEARRAEVVASGQLDLLG